jgi:hypothetical protein
MTNKKSATEILDQYLDNWLADVLKRCEGIEQQALIEFVRSADLHAYFAHFHSVEKLGAQLYWRTKFISHGLGPILKTFLPALEQYGDGIPWAPTNDKLATWADTVLSETGQLDNLRRLAHCERYGLVRSEVISDDHISITLTAKRSELLDIGDHAWLIERELGNNANFIESLEAQTRGWARDRIDEYVDIDSGWFIRYDSDTELLKHYRDLARINFIKSPESEALPDSARLGPRTFGEWRELAIMAAGRAMLHISFATRLSALNKGQLDLRNLLTIYVRHEDLRAVWRQQTGLTDDKSVEEIADIFMLTSETAEAYFRDHDYSLPFHIRFGKYFALLPLFASVINPCTFLATELKRRYRKDWDRAVNEREKKFCLDLYQLLQTPRYIPGPENFTLRSANGEMATDIDAVLFDSHSNGLYLFQLKWFDVFGLSLKERHSKIQNLLKVNKWVELVWNWAMSQSSDSVLRALKLRPNTLVTKPLTIRLFVLTRYSARFSGSHKFDARAAWLSWPAFSRLILEHNDHQAPLESTWESAISGGEDDPAPSSACTEYRFPNLRVDVYVPN